MKLFKKAYEFLMYSIAVAFCLLCGIGDAQNVPAPQIGLSGNVGVIGSPVLNSGPFQMPSDADVTFSNSNVNTSAVSIKITSAVSLTATRTIHYPAGRFRVDVCNATTGGQSIVIIGPSGSGVTIANGVCQGVWNNGTDYVPIGSGGSSGVSQIIAGTNVTISPSGGTGAVTVNASGGGTPNTINILSAPYYASGSAFSTTTSGTVAPGTSVAVASCGDFVASEGVYIAGAGAASGQYSQYIGTVASCSSGTMIVSPATSTSVSSVSTTIAETSGSDAITLTSATGVHPGYLVTASGLLAGTQVISISGNVAQLSQSATATGSVSATLAPSVMHDETAAIQAALSTVSVTNSTNILFPDGTYNVNGQIKNPSAANAILITPDLPYLATPVAGPASLNMYGVTPPGVTGDVGAIIKTIQVGTAGSGPAASWLISGFGTETTGGLPGNISNISAYLKNLTFRTYDNPNIAVVNGYNWASTSAENVFFDTHVVQTCPYVEGVCNFVPNWPTHPNATALSMPSLDNFGLNALHNVRAYFYYTPYYLTEHTYLDNTWAGYSQNCYYIYNPVGHAVYGSLVHAEHCQNDFSGIANEFHISLLENESLDNGTPNPGNVTTNIINDPSNTLYGSLNFEDRYLGQGGGSTVVLNGGANVAVQNLHTITTNVNPTTFTGGLSAVQGTTGTPFSSQNTNAATSGVFAGLCPNLGGGFLCYEAVGHDLSANNAVTFGFRYAGSGSTANALELAEYADPNPFLWSSKVGTWITAPAGGLATLNVYNTSSGANAPVTSFFSPNISTSAGAATMGVGTQAAANDASLFGFINNGAGSSTNHAFIAMYNGGGAALPGLCLFPNGHTSIGVNALTCTAASMLTVIGSLSAGSSNQFAVDTSGNMTTPTLSGPSVAPSGACATNGQWVFSQDGHATFCASGTWTTKI